MDPRIRNLTSTTFGGERLSRRALAEIQETVQFFPQLSRTELAQTVCEQLGWHTPGGSTRLRFSLACWGSWSGWASCSCRPGKAADGGRRSRCSSTLAARPSRPCGSRWPSWPRCGWRR